MVGKPDRIPVLENGCKNIAFELEAGKMLTKQFLVHTIEDIEQKN